MDFWTVPRLTPSRLTIDALLDYVPWADMRLVRQGARRVLRHGQTRDCPITIVLGGELRSAATTATTFKMTLADAQRLLRAADDAPSCSKALRLTLLRRLRAARPRVSRD